MLRKKGYPNSKHSNNVFSHAQGGGFEKKKNGFLYRPHSKFMDLTLGFISYALFQFKTTVVHHLKQMSSNKICKEYIK